MNPKKHPPKRLMTARKIESIEGLPKVSWQQIDPEKAEEMLKLLESNRRLVSNHVQFLAREMAENRWKINGDTIRFSGRRLLDGQHRLHAVIQSDMSVWFLVVEELSDETFSTIDTGRFRQAGDVLSAIGYSKYPFLMAAACRFIWYFDHGYPLETSMRISNEEIIQTAKKNPSVQFLGDYIANQKALRGSSILAAMVLIARKVGRETTLKFAEKLALGDELRADDPIRFLRDKWMMEGTHRGDRGHRAMWIAITIKTFNLWITKRRVDRVATFQNPTEKFPVVLREGEAVKETE